jgi:sortase A
VTITHRAVRRAAYVFFAAGLLALGYAAFVVIATRAYQGSGRQRFERARAETSVAPAAIEGMAIGTIEIARLGLTAVIVQGASSDILQRAVGHVTETALPGESGNVVLAAHRDTFFRPLKGIRVGDEISVRTLTGDFAYVVVSTAVVAPDAIEVLRPTREPTLTLVTCFPFAYLGSAPNRFIVRAREVDVRTRARKIASAWTARPARTTNLIAVNDQLQYPDPDNLLITVTKASK